MKLNPAMSQPFLKLLAYRERSRNYPNSPALGRERRAADWKSGDTADWETAARPLSRVHNKAPVKWTG